MKKLNLKSVSADTWIRTAVLLIALINQGFVLTGAAKKTVDIDTLTCYASYILTACSALWSWWKNNSFTKKAQQADCFLHSETDAKG